MGLRILISVMVTLLLLLAALPTWAGDLTNIHTIYIDTMGTTDGAIAFHDELTARLIKSGLTLTQDPNAADAILSGTFTSYREQGATNPLTLAADLHRSRPNTGPTAPNGMNVMVRLKRRSGETLWSYDKDGFLTLLLARKVAKELCKVLPPPQKI